jgi:hypothetical protein
MILREFNGADLYSTDTNLWMMSGTEEYGRTIAGR